MQGAGKKEMHRVCASEIEQFRHYHQMLAPAQLQICR